MALSKWILGACLAFMAAATAGAATPTFPKSALGDWMGKVQDNDTTRYLFVHIHQTFHGDYVARVNSPDRAAFAVPLAAPEGGLAFVADEIQFEGKWDQANGRWAGTWTEAGVSTPLTLSLNDDSTAQRLETMRNIMLMPRIGARGTIPAPPDIVPASAR